ncbi:pimeloyl-ACP methyl ester esterase BioH [Vibrio marisflavi]|uniref:Pimeloyl-[acyl-carrier protein] methyl ester esterase n=1 Tax=Vibrio marisflavi CECT 7928 TaxID=634439 RepID=A0ABM9A9X3_9VIBR|nr:pimeloyl-ACP methyl ester esterase BioH [Vibrio marisflavi]CAH0541846.1 Pimeloyl-[acyl-carrier protein] methyl ester esterase [Vibrio marisflavi CECT 7928]
MVENVNLLSSLYWQTIGEGKDIVLLHGWGMNGAVWQQAAEKLSESFKVHIVDLPGYGHSHAVKADDLDVISELLLKQAPEQAIWVGWSLGGLIASHIAIHHPDRVEKLITVSSSPKFAAEKPWRGIQPAVLKNFTQQLMEDFKLTVERFMALQAMGSPTAKSDLKQLKKSVLTRPEPNTDALLYGLSLLADVDQRQQLQNLTLPILRLYGRLDGLVPIKVAHDLQNLLPTSSQFVFSQSSHAPFMTELDAFCDQVTEFSL